MRLFNLEVSGRGTLGVPLLFFLTALVLASPPTPAHSASPPSPSASSPVTSVIIDDFEAGLSPKWEIKSFVGETSYEVVRDGDNRVLKAHTEGNASGLVYKLKLELDEFPVLVWRWKVEGVFEDGDARVKSRDDYPARVYVVFPGWIPLFTRSINYIWANKLPKGESLPSTFYSKSIMVALQSGNDRAGEWVTERRNVVEDYKKLFGTSPPKISAIAIMTDADQTGATATAYYDDLRFESAIGGSVPLDTGAAKR